MEVPSSFYIALQQVVNAHRPPSITHNLTGQEIQHVKPSNPICLPHKLNLPSLEAIQVKPKRKHSKKKKKKTRAEATEDSDWEPNTTISNLSRNIKPKHSMRNKKKTRAETTEDSDWEPNTAISNLSRHIKPRRSLRNKKKTCAEAIARNKYQLKEWKDCNKSRNNARKPPKKPRNAPKKPKQAFDLFKEYWRGQISDDNPDWSSAVVSKFVYNLWFVDSRVPDDKQDWFEAANDLRRQYEIDKMQYRQSYEWQRYKRKLKEWRNNNL